MARSVDATCLSHDGTNVMFVDWETSGAGDEWFDVATLPTWLLLDDDLTSVLVRAYSVERGIAPPSSQRFASAQQLVRVAYGATFLELVREPQPDIPLSALPSLVECYAGIGSGTLDIGTDAGRWQLAAALLGTYLSPGA